MACGNIGCGGRASLAKVLASLQDRPSGEMAEWLKAHAWKACVRETVPWVRIPLSPPSGSKRLHFSAFPEVGSLPAHIPSHTLRWTAEALISTSDVSCRGGRKLA